MTAYEKQMKKWGSGIAWLLAIVLIALSAQHNYDLVFNQYRANFDLSAWNTTEMGAVVRQFADTVGSEDTAWLVGYPHWADSRLVMINAGVVKDNAIWPDQFHTTTVELRAKLFLVNIADEYSLNLLKNIYPNGSLALYDSDIEGKDFWTFFVPEQSELEPLIP